jgi:hypothetical protein
MNGKADLSTMLFAMQAGSDTVAEEKPPARNGKFSRRPD